MNIHSQPARAADEGFGDEQEVVPSVADPETGEVRLLKARCTTCVLTPAATAAPLSPKRRKDFLGEAVRGKSHMVCHSTAEPAASPGTPAAMCRGFADAYGLPAAVQEALELSLGYIVEVLDPTKQVGHLPPGKPDAGEMSAAHRTEALICGTRVSEAIDRAQAYTKASEIAAVARGAPAR